LRGTHRHRTRLRVRFETPFELGVCTAEQTMLFGLQTRLSGLDALGELPTSDLPGLTEGFAGVVRRLPGGYGGFRHDGRRGVGRVIGRPTRTLSDIGDDLLELELVSAPPARAMACTPMFRAWPTKGERSTPVRLPGSHIAPRCPVDQCIASATTEGSVIIRSVIITADVVWS
jgi:hypothetical protein